MGYRRVHGEPLVLGVKVAPSTVWEVLKDAGIDPAPERAAGTWAAFLRSQADALLACDFIETVTLTGTRMHLLAVIEHRTRRIRILGATAHPTVAWVVQAARNLVMDLEDVPEHAERPGILRSPFHGRFVDQCGTGVIEPQHPPVPVPEQCHRRAFTEPGTRHALVNDRQRLHQRHRSPNAERVVQTPAEPAGHPLDVIVLDESEARPQAQPWVTDPREIVGAGPPAHTRHLITCHRHTGWHQVGSLSDRGSERCPCRKPGPCWSSACSY